MSKKWPIANTLPLTNYTQRALSFTVAAFVIINLTACDPGREVVSTPPPSLLTCASEPAPPNLPDQDGTPEVQRTRDLLMLDAYLALRAAYGSCAANLAGVRAWSEEVR